MVNSGMPALASLACRLLRAPLLLAPAVLAAAFSEMAGVPGAHASGRAAVVALLASYLAAGVVNVVRFPRFCRGPATPRVVDAWLLDGWTVVAFVVAVAAVHDGSVAGLL